MCTRPGTVSTSKLAFLCLLVLAASGCQAGPPPDVVEAVNEARASIMALDPQSAIRTVEAVEDAGGTPELRAWYLTALARADRPEEAEAAARAMVEADEANPWGWLALTASLMEQRNRQDEALEASERAYALAPESPDVLWMHAQALVAADENRAAIELVDENIDALASPAPLIHQKSRALYYLAFEGRSMDADLQEQSVAAAREARTLDPGYAAAWYGEGTVYFSQRRFDEALEALSAAADASPGSVSIQQRLGQTIAAMPELTPAQKQERTGERVAQLEAAHPDEPAALGAIANMWGSVGADERKQAVEAMIRERHPESLAAEWLAVNEYREVRGRIAAAERGGADPDPAEAAEYERLLREFLAREHHNRPTLKGDAFRSLYYVVREQESPDPDELLWIVRGMADFEGINPHTAFAAGAITLAEETDHHEEAMEIALRGLDAGRARIDGQRSAYDNDGDYESAIQRMDANMYDAIGWVHFQAGRRAEAETELLRAYDNDPKNRTNLHHLGRLYEELDEVEEAERFYIQGLAVQGLGENPSRAALAELYEGRTGSSEGFDAYLADLERREADTRHSTILAERIADPAAVPPFELLTLDGERVTSGDLEGSITVINFWGIWCGWCVIEMPELQALHERYADDPEVRILTINNDNDPDDVPPWMEENGYTMPVLLDDEYVATDASVYIFPTTWFLDRDGRLAFVKEGWSQELIQEFTWRIEALRGGD